ncbi:hypothetical protein ACKC9G_15145 [Pokkaliibacter sp. CJK22405]|uniref:hypothetical protein n=1 Tax=Pokkaliibacter sp. CJK22405 TaxID=3384615 RepID=UPI0039849048
MGHISHLGHSHLINSTLAREMDRLNHSQATDQPQESKQVTENRLNEVIHNPEITSREKIDAMATVIGQSPNLNSAQRHALTKAMSELASTNGLNNAEKSDMRGLMKAMMHNAPLEGGSDLDKDTAKLQFNLSRQLKDTAGGASQAGFNLLASLPGDKFQQITSGFLDDQSQSNLRKADSRLGMQEGVHVAADNRDNFNAAMKALPAAPQNDPRIANMLPGGRENAVEAQWAALPAHLEKLPAESNPSIGKDGKELPANETASHERSLRGAFLMNALSHAVKNGQLSQAMPHLMPAMTQLPDAQQGEVLGAAVNAMKQSGDFSALANLHHHVHEELRAGTKLEVYAEYPGPERNQEMASQLGNIDDMRVQVGVQTNTIMQNVHRIAPENQAAALTNMVKIGAKSNYGVEAGPLAQRGAAQLPNMSAEHAKAAFNGMNETIVGLKRRPLHQALAARDLIQNLEKTDVPLKDQALMQLPLMKGMDGIDQKAPIFINVLGNAEKLDNSADRAEVAHAMLKDLKTLNISLEEGKGVDQPQYAVAMTAMIGLVKSLDDTDLTPELTDALVDAHNFHAEGNPEHYQAVVDIKKRAADAGMEPGKKMPEFKTGGGRDQNVMSAFGSLMALQKAHPMLIPTSLLPAFQMMGKLGADDLKFALNQQMDMFTQIPKETLQDSMMVNYLASVFAQTMLALRQLPDSVKDVRDDAINRLNMAMENLIPPASRQSGDFLQMLHEYTGAMGTAGGGADNEH